MAQADKFVKLLRAVVAEEVRKNLLETRKIIREELKLMLLEMTESENNHEQPKEDSRTINEEVVDFRSKYSDLFKVPTTKSSKKSNGLNSNGSQSGTAKKPTTMDMLAETVNDMKRDPHASSFFEGLR